MIENFATVFDKDARKRIGREIVDRFIVNARSRSKRIARIKDIYGHIILEPKPKQIPWTGCANIRTPLLAAPWLQQSSRLLDMLLQQSGRIASVYSPSDFSAKEAALAERFFNYYLQFEMYELEFSTDATVGQSVAVGSSFMRTFYDPVDERTKSEHIPLEDLVAPAKSRSQDPSMRDMDEYSMVRRLSLSRIARHKDAAGWIETDDLKPTTIDEPEGSTVADMMDRVDGVDEPNRATPRLLVEHHFRLEMPRKPKSHHRLDGKEHAVMATVDYETGKLHHMAIREEGDPRDFQSYSREKQIYDDVMRSFESDMRRFDSGELKVEPDPPTLEQPFQKVREFSLFTHFRACPGDGFYGIGSGDFLLGLVKANNTIINQSLDAATMRISRGGYISRQLRGPRGMIATQPGQLTEVDAPMGSIKDGIYYPEMPPGDPFVPQILSMIQGMAQNLVGSMDTMSGDIPGSNQSAQGVMALIEQAQMPITIMAKRERWAFRHMLEKVWRCLGTFTPDSKVVDMIGADGAVQSVQVGAHLFRPESHILPVGDPRLKTQRVQDAHAELQSALQNPIIMQSPAGFEILRNLTAQFYRAQGNEKVVALIESMPPPGPPPPPQGVPPGPPGNGVGPTTTTTMPGGQQQ